MDVRHAGSYVFSLFAFFCHFPSEYSWTDAPPLSGVRQPSPRAFISSAYPSSCPCPPSRTSSGPCASWRSYASSVPSPARSEEHTSELQSRLHLVCRLLL